MLDLRTSIPFIRLLCEIVPTSRNGPIAWEQEQGEAWDAIAIRVHQPSRWERLGPGSSASYRYLILPPASHPIEPLRTIIHTQWKYNRPPVYPMGLHPAPQSYYPTLPITSTDLPHPLMPRSRMRRYIRSVLQLFRGILTLRVRYRDRAVRALAGARPRHYTVFEMTYSMCARTPGTRPSDLRTQFLH